MEHKGSAQRADVIVGSLWTLLGLAVVVGSSRIDRLTEQGVEWFAAPGLLPAVLGVCIALFGALLAWRGARAAATPGPGTVRGTAVRVFVTLVLCIGFAAGLVGHGLPFGVVAFIYLFLHVLVLEWPQRRDTPARLRGVALATTVAIGGALIVPFVFERLFLVRLP